MPVPCTAGVPLNQN